MPTKRKRRERSRIEFDYSMRVHLEEGTCLLAGRDKGCGCGLLGVDGALQADVARVMWRAHRDEILAGWTRPVPPWAALEFDGKP
jgi:hypothetical protein